MPDFASLDRPLAVFVADPNEVSRAGLCAILAADLRFTVVGEAAGPDISLVQQLRPDLVVLDPDVGGRLDLQCVADLAAALPETRIFLRTSVLAPLEPLEAGALAYVLKADASVAFLRDALAVVGHFGAAVTGPAVVRRSLERLACRQALAIPRPQAAGGEPEGRSTPLTVRQREVLTLVVQGAPYEEIGRQLRIEAGTVAMHVQHMLTKTGAKNRSELCYLTGRQGLA